MQAIMDLFSKTCTAFGLTIRLKKTKVMFTPPPGHPYVELNIFVEGTRLDVVDSFVYLGSTLSRDGLLDSEIHLRIEKASKAFGKLENRLLSDRAIAIKTKLSVYELCVLIALLYSSETWTMYHQHIKALERFHQTCLRRIPNIKWSLTPNTVFLQQGSTYNIEMLIICNQMHWAGLGISLGWKMIGYLKNCSMESYNVVNVQDINLRNVLRMSLKTTLSP